MNEAEKELTIFFFSFIFFTVVNFDILLTLGPLIIY